MLDGLAEERPWEQPQTAGSPAGGAGDPANPSGTTNTERFSIGAGASAADLRAAGFTVNTVTLGG